MLEHSAEVGREKLFQLFLTKSGVDEQLRHTLRVVVLLVLEDIAGRHFLLHLSNGIKMQ